MVVNPLRKEEGLKNGSVPDDLEGDAAIFRGPVEPALESGSDFEQTFVDAWLTEPIERGQTGCSADGVAIECAR